MYRKLLLLVFLASISVKLLGQDPQFSQFYALPLYLNPGFTGTTPDNRFVMNYRNQWIGLPNSFSSYAFSYDFNMKSLNSGFGVLATTDKAGSANLQSTNLGFLYAYKVHLGDKWVFSPGINFGYSIRSIDYNKLVFGDQLEFGDSPITNDPSINSYQNVSFVDFGSGFLVYNKKFWGGFSAHHMNRPNSSLLEGNSRLPMKISVHAGVKIPLYKGPQKRSNISSVSPSFVYKKQGQFDQLDMGIHFAYNPVMIGFWYRGIPVQKSESGRFNHDAVSFLFGLKFDGFDVGYSYDMTVSGLGANTGGSHEISLIYQLSIQKSRKVKRREKYIPCPTF